MINVNTIRVFDFTKQIIDRDPD